MATSTRLPPVDSTRGAPLGRGWPNVARYAQTIVTTYADNPPRDANERRHLTVARASLHPNPMPRVHIQRVHTDTQGYDSGGAYWGLGKPLYYAWSDCGTIDLWFRAGDRIEACRELMRRVPSARLIRTSR